ncbi:MAG: hypothetical protein ACI95C_001744 [Pseudohongiellaceae bacterium]|jgi:hypothetical protein
MTVYEASDLFTTYLDTYFQFMFGYVGILSTFLIMSFVAADRLNNALSVLVTALFTIVCAMLVIQVNFIRTDLVGLNSYLFELKALTPDSLEWFGNNPLWAVRALTFLTNIVLFGGYVGSIGYFIYQRTGRQSAKDT